MGIRSVFAVPHIGQRIMESTIGGVLFDVWPEVGGQQKTMVRPSKVIFAHLKSCRQIGQPLRRQIDRKCLETLVEAGEHQNPDRDQYNREPRLGPGAAGKQSRTQAQDCLA